MNIRIAKTPRTIKRVEFSLSKTRDLKDIESLVSSERVVPMNRRISMPGSIPRPPIMKSFREI